jgi:hypothetical protein
VTQQARQFAWTLPGREEPFRFLIRLKTELGLDHFEGRSFPGWQHHVVLTAVAYAFLQRERMRGDVDPALTLPAARAIVTEIFTALLFAQKPSLSETDPRTTEHSTSDLTK